MKPVKRIEEPVPVPEDIEDNLEKRKDRWRRLFMVHDTLKVYYIKIFVLLLFAGPLRFLFSLELWNDLVTTPGEVEMFLTVALLVGILIIMIWCMIFFTTLRFIFPKYVIVRGENRYIQGRVYWFSHSRIGKWGLEKRMWCGAPYTPFPYVLVNRTMLFNPLAPWNSMYKYLFPSDTKYVRHPLELRIWTPPHIKRHTSLSGDEQYIIAPDESVLATMVENIEPSIQEETKMQEMIVSTRKAAQASIPHIRESLRYGSFDFSMSSQEELKQKIKDKKRELGIMEADDEGA